MALLAKKYLKKLQPSLTIVVRNCHKTHAARHALQVDNLCHQHVFCSSFSHLRNATWNLNVSLWKVGLFVAAFATQNMSNCYYLLLFTALKKMLLHSKRTCVAFFLCISLFFKTAKESSVECRHISLSLGRLQWNKKRLLNIHVHKGNSHYKKWSIEIKICNKDSILLPFFPWDFLLFSEATNTFLYAICFIVSTLSESSRKSGTTYIFWCILITLNVKGVEMYIKKWPFVAKRTELSFKINLRGKLEMGFKKPPLPRHGVKKMFMLRTL